MHLLPCSEPSVRLDPAPLTTLCASPSPAASAGESLPPHAEYAGFWGADDRYYLRRTAARGTEWLVGTLEGAGTAGGPAGDSQARPASGAHRAVAAAAALERPARLRVMLVGRQHAGRRTRVAMHLCVRRVRHA